MKKLNAMGASSINVSITHGMFNGSAIEKLKELHQQGVFETIYITNSVYRDALFYPDFVKVIDASNNFADPLKSICI